MGRKELIKKIAPYVAAAGIAAAGIGTAGCQTTGTYKSIDIGNDYIGYASRDKNGSAKLRFGPNGSVYISTRDKSGSTTWRFSGDSDRRSRSGFGGCGNRSNFDRY